MVIRRLADAWAFTLGTAALTDGQSTSTADQGLKGRDSTVSSLNPADGEAVWSKILGPTANDDRGSGPRGTQTVDDDRVYVLTESGDLACGLHSLRSREFVEP